MHGRDRQAVWVASQAGQGCKAYQRADRQGRHPVTATSRQLLPGERGQSPRDHWVAASWQLIYASSQLRWCLFKCKGRTRLADSAAIHALVWTGGNHTHTHSRTHSNSWKNLACWFFFLEFDSLRWYVKHKTEAQILVCEKGDKMQPQGNSSACWGFQSVVKTGQTHTLSLKPCHHLPGL